MEEEEEGEGLDLVVACGEFGIIESCLEALLQLVKSWFVQSDIDCQIRIEFFDCFRVLVLIRVAVDEFRCVAEDTVDICRAHRLVQGAPDVAALLPWSLLRSKCHPSSCC